MKATKLLVAGAAIISAGFGLSGNVGAATGSGPGTANNNISAGNFGEGFTPDGNGEASALSTSEVEIVGGILSLDAVPDFHFGTLNIAEFDAGDIEQPLLSGTLAYDSYKTTQDGNDQLFARVTDFRGTGEGWQLAVSMSPFSLLGDPNVQIDGAELRLTVNHSGQSRGRVDIPTTEDNTAFVKLDEKEGFGQNEFNFVTGGNENQLYIPAQPIRSGAYHAVKTWTLSNTI